MRPATVLKLAGLAALLLVFVLIQVVKSIDVDQYRRVIAEAVQQATGRTVTLAGRVVLRLSLTPYLEANDVTFANVKDSSAPAMLTASHVEAPIGLLPLLMGEVRIGRLRLTGVDLLLERAADGSANWELGGLPEKFPAADRVPPTILRIGEIRIEDARVLYVDRRSGEEDSFHIDRLTAEADQSSAPIAVTAVGSWARGAGPSRRFTVSGVLGSLNAALNSEKPFPIKATAVLLGLVATANGSMLLGGSSPSVSLAVTAEATEIADAAELIGVTVPALGAARLAMNLSGPLSAPEFSAIDLALGRRDGLAIGVKGSWASPWTGKGIDLAVVAEGESLVGWGKPFDVSLPTAGPVRLAAHMTDLGSGWRFSDIKWTIGHSDFGGQITVSGSTVRPFAEIQLSSANVDVAELTALQVDHPRSPDSSRFFSDVPLPLRDLTLADGTLAWHADHVTFGGVGLSGVDVRGGLREGRLQVVPQVEALAGGKLSGVLTIDTNGPLPAVAMTLDAESVLLGDLLKELAISANVAGTPTDLRIEAGGAGNSIRAVMAKLSGDVVLSMGSGIIGGGPSDGAVLALLGRLVPWAAEGRIDLHCLASRFSVADGMVRNEGFFLDSSVMSVAGQGSINLADEGLDMTFAPKPKDASLLSLAMPVDVGGTLIRPDVIVDRGAIVKGMPAPTGAAVPAAGGNTCLAALGPSRKSVPPRRIFGKPGVSPGQ